MMHDRRAIGFYDPEAAERELSRIFADREERDRLRVAASVRFDDSPWFAIRVRGSEREVADEMKAARIDAWCPQKKVMRRLPRRRAKYEGLQPLLPGYLLVRFAPSIEAILGVKSFERVDAILGTERGPLGLNTKEIKHLRALDESAKPERSGLGMIFSPGEEVEVTLWSMSGVEGVVTKGDDRHGTVEVLLEMFGRMTPVKLGIDQVRKVR